MPQLATGGVDGRFIKRPSTFLPPLPLPLSLPSPHPHFSPPSSSLFPTPHFSPPSLLPTLILTFPYPSLLSTLTSPHPHPHFSLPLTSPHPHPLHLHFTYALVAGQWASLGGQEQKEKERFLAAEQRASRGFMTQVSS